MKGYTVNFYVGNTGYVTYSRDNKPIIYTKRESAVRMRNRILRHGIPNPFSGCGRYFTYDACVEEVTIR